MAGDAQKSKKLKRMSISALTVLLVCGFLYVTMQPAPAPTEPIEQEIPHAKILPGAG